jgi:hypothetical protein
MRIRIIKASLPSLWYSDKIGEEYEVAEEDYLQEPEKYCVLTHTIAYVRFVDCEVIQ